MICNENLHRLTEMEIVKNFMRRHGFKAALSDNDCGLILYRQPYVVEFKDALIENYLEMYFSHFDDGIYMEGNSALGCSLDLGLQRLNILRARDLTHEVENGIFLSENYSKT